MGVNCKIEFIPADNLIYRPGNTVRGIIYYSINKETKFKSIDVCFIGEAETEFKISYDEVDRRKSYHGKNIICEEERSIIKSPAEGRITVRSPGTYKSEFEFKIPYNAPSSCNFESGSIRYRIMMVFKKPYVLTEYFGLDFGGKRFFKEVKVIGYVKPVIKRHPAIFESEQAVSLPFFSVKEKVEIKVSVNQTCIKPGEYILLNYEILNRTKKEIEAIEFFLSIKTFYYDAVGHSKCHVDRQKLKLEEHCKYKHVNRLNGKIRAKIPDNAQTIQNCVIIHQYEVCLVAKFPFPFKNAEQLIPLVIGEISNEFVVDLNEVMFPHFNTNFDNTLPSYWEVVTDKIKLLK